MPPFWRLLAPLLVIGCGELREREVSAECASCHGGLDHDDGRPPPDLLGSTDTTSRGVGAHAAHLDSPMLGKPLDCDTCHVVPESVRDEGHLDRTEAEKDTPADVIIAGWEATELRCSGSDCHARSGAAHPAPLWTQVDESQIGCDGCHGNPPPDPHPDDTRCSLCHPGVNKAGDDFDDVTTHLNLKVDLTPDDDCASCHGNPPGPDLDDNTDVSFVGVGAHLAHVESELSDTVKNAACESCHQSPQDALDEGHIDSASPAEVRFDLGLGITGGATPSWDGDADPPTCTNTYCHGTATPVWTDPTDDYRACVSCHGAPPPAPHPDDVRCSLCHPGVNSTNDGFSNPSQHVDGLVQLEPVAGCDGCHGSPASPAPPPDLAGNILTTAPGVGAHQAHLQSGVACTACHVVPASALDAGHFDTPRPAEVDASLGWDGTQCNTAPCHTRSGATNPMPQWTDGTPLGCDSCHGFPPPAPHTTWTGCFSCHTSFPATHVDGAPDVADLDAMACDTCHGSPATPAPPPDLAGSSLTTDPGVGAHATHGSGGLGSAPVACVECHAVPVLASDAGHLDTGPPADVVFGPLASAGGSMPLWDGAGCSGVYCHQASGAAGGANTMPVWTLVDSSQNACGTCHDLPPPSHVGYMTPDSCENCHATAIGGTPPTIVDPCLHINGVRDNALAVGCP